MCASWPGGYATGQWHTQLGRGAEGLGFKSQSGWFLSLHVCLFFCDIHLHPTPSPAYPAVKWGPGLIWLGNGKNQLAVLTQPAVVCMALYVPTPRLVAQLVLLRVLGPAPGGCQRRPRDLSSARNRSADWGVSPALAGGLIHLSIFCPWMSMRWRMWSMCC